MMAEMATRVANFTGIRRQIPMLLRWLPRPRTPSQSFQGLRIIQKMAQGLYKQDKLVFLTAEAK